MKRSLKRTLGVVSAFSLAFLVACGGDNNNAATNDANDANDTNDSNNNTTEEENDSEEVVEAEGGIDGPLVFAMGTDMVSWDIHDHGNTSTEAVHVNVFDYLFKRNQDTMEYEPHLVSEYESLEDDLWEFQLRDDVYFHNGDQLTAEDVKWTYERVINDDSLSEHSRFTQLGEIEIIDEFTIHMRTDGPQPATINRLAQVGAGILPMNYIEENGMDHFLSEPVGSGPYKYVDWIRDDRVILEKFDNYFLGDDFTEWDEVVFRAIPESSTRVGELLTGNAHVITDIPPNEWSRVDDNEGTHHVNSSINRTMLLIVRQTEGVPTSDPRVVEAIDYAINNEAITEQVMHGSATPTRTRVTPGNVGANEDLYDTFLFDPDHSRALLTEAGYEDGLELTLQSPSGRYLMDADIAEVLVAMLAEVGITLNLEFLEWSQFIEHYQANTNKDLMFLGLGSSLFDSAQALDHYPSHSPLNEGRMDYSNEEFDRLFAEAEVNMDPADRISQYQRMQEILAEERPHIYLHEIDANFGVSDFVHYTPRRDEMYYANEVTKR